MTGLCAFSVSGIALADVDVGVYLGVPAPVYVAPPVVYAPPPPPVIYEAPDEVYGPGVVIVGGRAYPGWDHERDRDWRRPYGAHGHWKRHHRDDENDD
ncbi:hypothetical protein [Castellaniella sp. MT123]|uniref:hypothetical protein n=1 Tax=Castellaniella sp. MT123 TaxID=3140381 RepID=UPI0031F42A1B